LADIFTKFKSLSQSADPQVAAEEQGAVVGLLQVRGLSINQSINQILLNFYNLLSVSPSSHFHSRLWFLVFSVGDGIFVNWKPGNVQYEQGSSN
jgi:hypothetical protein